MSDEIWDASEFELIEDPPARSRRGRTLAVLAIVGVAALSLGTIAIVGMRISRRVLPAPPLPTVLPHDTPAAQSQMARQVFSNYDQLALQDRDLPADQLAERDAVIARLEELAAWARDGDDEAFHAAIDWDLFMARIEATGLPGEFTAHQRDAHLDFLRENVECNSQWSSLEFVAMVASEDHPDTRIVYCYGRFEYDDAEAPMRLWLVRDGDSWKFFDWQDLDFGLADSYHFAVIAKYDDSEPIHGYYQWMALREEAGELSAQGLHEQTDEKLRQAEMQPIVPELRDYCWTAQGYLWSAYSRYADAERCFQSVADPRHAPGGYHERMLWMRWNDPAGALQNAEAYEAAVGPTPKLLRIKAQSLAELGRDAQAADVWRSYLKMRPDDPDALTAWYRSLPAGGDTSEFEQYMARAGDKLALASHLAVDLIRDDEVGRADSLIEMLQRVAPDAAATHFALGVRQQWDGEFLDAVRSQQQALALADEDDEDRIEYFFALLSASADAGRFLAPLRTGDHEELDFQLASAFFTECTQDEQRELIDLYRQQFPESTEGAAEGALMAYRERDWARVERLAVPLLPRLQAEVDDDDDEGALDAAESLTQVKSALGTARLRLGRVADAYATWDDRAVGFSQLTVAAEQANLWDALEELIALHERTHPDAPDLLVARGDLAVYRENYGQAASIYISALEGLTEDEARSVTMRLADICRRHQLWALWYRQSTDPYGTFAALARGMIDGRQWRELAELMEMHREFDPNDGQLLEVESEIAWEQQYYARYASLADKLLSRTGDASLQYGRAYFEQRRLEALLRTRDWRRLDPLTANSLETDADWQSRALFLAGRGRARDAISALRKGDVQNSFLSPYWHDVVGPKLFTQPYEELRRDFPVPLTIPSTTTAIVFVDEPLEATDRVVRAAAGEAGLGGRVAPMTRIGPAGQKAAGAVVQLADARVWVVAGTGPFQADWDLDPAQPALAAIDDSSHWVAVGVTAFDSDRRRELRPAAQRMLAAIVGEHARAIAHRRYPAWQGYVALQPGDDAAALWADGDDPFEHSDIVVPIHAVGYSPHVNRDRAFRDGLYSAMRRLEDKPFSKLVVWTHLLGDAKADPVRVAVKRAERSLDGWSLTGTLEDDSALVPQLQRGMSVKLHVDRAAAWQFNRQRPVFRDQ